MAVVEFSIRDFNKLLGKELTIKEMKEIIPMLGVGWDGNDDEVFSIEVEPNRPDLLSVEGLVRNIKGILNIEKGLVNYEFPYSGEVLKVENVKGRKYIGMAVVKEVEINEYFLKSIIQIQEKLHITHGRRRKRVAIGIHDYDKVKGPFRYYCEKDKGFKFIPLDFDREMSLEEILMEHPKGRDYGEIVKEYKGYPLIVDSNGNVLSFPPIINGELTRVTEKTKNILIDVTGTDEISVNQALNILVAMFYDRGGKVEKIKIEKEGKEVYSPVVEYMSMNLDLDYVSKISGLRLSKEEVKDLLERMRYGVDISNGFKIKVPLYRVDIMHPYDVIEDVVIAYGYNNVEPLRFDVYTESGLSFEENVIDKLRDLMIGYGLQEVLSFALSSKNKLYDKMNIEDFGTVEMENSLTEDYSCLRSWLLPGLMETLSINTNKRYPQKLFEIDKVSVLDNNEDSGAKDIYKLAVVMADTGIDYNNIKELFDTFNEITGLGLSIKESSHGSFIDGRRADIYLEDIKIGFMGEIHPKVLKNFGLEVPVVAMEIELDVLIDKLKDDS